MDETKHLARIVAEEYDGETLLMLEIPREVIDGMNFVDGEVLSAETDGNSIILKRIGIVDNGN